MRRWLLALIATLLWFWLPAARADESTRPILLLDIKGAIGVATTMHFEAAMKQAVAQRAELLVLRMDTPGGLVDATRVLIQGILSAPVPVAVYVAPSGARAASAGTYISYAAHVAAMAPGTHLGAATPVALGAPGAPQEPARRTPDGKDTPRDGSTAMERKVLNDAVAYIRSLAQLRGRNADWAEKAVRDAATLTAEEAARDKVVDLLASDLDSLLAQIDGRTIKLASGERQLATKGRQVVSIVPDWRMRIIAAIANPNVALILMMIGFYGILLEFWHPGTLMPGVIGGISLLIGFAALSVLPVSMAGLALLLLGLALITAEMFTPGLGVLGIGGLVAFAFGAVFLFDPAGADFDLSVSWPVILATTAASGLFLLLVMGFAVRARRRPVRSGAEEMIGISGHVVAWEGSSGRVRVHGEIWSARGAASLAAGDPIRVVRRDGLTLDVQSPT